MARLDARVFPKLSAVCRGSIKPGHHLIGGSVIIDPEGEIAAQAATEDDELIVQGCDLDACNFGKQTIFDFGRHRRIEHYGLISAQTGVVRPEA